MISMRTYMHQSTSEIHKTIEKNQPEITKHYLESLPDSVRFDQGFEINPFALYNSYLKMNKPIAYSLLETKDRAELMRQKVINESLMQEVNSQQKLTKMFLDIEKDYKGQINMLVAENKQLRATLSAETSMLLREITDLKRNYQTEVDFLTDHIQKYRQYVELELAGLTSIMNRIDHERNTFKHKIKMLKFILRTPRLYRQYNQLFQKLLANKRMFDEHLR
jgi:hypothetical protein